MHPLGVAPYFVDDLGADAASLALDQGGSYCRELRFAADALADQVVEDLVFAAEVSGFNLFFKRKF